MEKKKKKLKTYNFYTVMMQALRPVWRNHPTRREFFKNSRSAPNTWICAECGKKCAGASKGKKSEFRIDHIEPVIPLTGFTNWDDVIRRLITGPHNLQVLCLECHGVKSKAENAARRKHKKDLL
jgi:hypothetical protein